jgi:Tfp pilus assembly ATPase PilU
MKVNDKVVMPIAKRQCRLSRPVKRCAFGDERAAAPRDFTENHGCNFAISAVAGSFPRQVLLPAQPGRHGAAPDPTLDELKLPEILKKLN